MRGWGEGASLLVVIWAPFWKGYIGLLSGRDLFSMEVNR